MIRNNNGCTYCSIVTHDTIRNNNIDVRDDTAYDGGISHNGVDIIPDTDRDLVNSGVVYVVQLLFYNLQGFDHYNKGHTFVVIYDIRVFNNNDTPTSGHLSNINDIPGCISGVENDCSGTLSYGNNNISFIDIYGAIVVHLAYNSVAIVATLDTISSSSERSFVRLSSELAPVPSLSSNIFPLSSDCGLVRLEHVPIALVASPETICSLSSPYLSPVLKSLCNSSPGLYSCSSSSHAKCPSSISFSVPSTDPSFEPSIAPSYLCFTRPIYDILFLKRHTESFLSYSYDHIHDHGVVLVSRIQSYSMSFTYLLYIPPNVYIQNVCPL
mmetsp:Transcript_44609/g.48271  ORF Transcript_44609/g.48271 Transcript_44609/m.48271 type:complete len:326 (+) Transcript_44609:758-1735(+)